MRFLFLLLITFSLASTSCIKDPYPAKGVLVGYDPRDCACCGGFFVNLNNDTTVNANTKVAGSLPSGFTFDASEFPLRVQFAYQNGGGCLPENITITKIKRR